MKDKVQFQSSNNQIIYPLTLSIKFLAEGWFLSLQFCSPVLISSINKPKLYMSDWAEISPLYRYSGAMYPLDAIIIKSLLGNTEDAKMEFVL